jgi:hypothetical protein
VERIVSSVTWAENAYRAALDLLRFDMRVIAVVRTGAAADVDRPVYGVEAWQLLTELNEAQFLLAGMVDGQQVDRSVARVIRLKHKSP